MPNIHGLSSVSRRPKDEDKEEFSGGGSSSHTAVMRNHQNRGGRGGDSKKPLATITMYSNGFIVSGDDVGFRDSADAKNKAMLEDIKKGVVPRELEARLAAKVGPNTRDVPIAVVDKSGERYDPPKPKFTAFSGKGQSLMSAPSGPQNTSLASVSPKKAAVDASSPTARILFVLHPRKRSPQTFNLTHTVLDVYRHILSLTPSLGSFDLVTGFPPKSILGDPSKTIDELKLKGAQVTQRKTG